MGETGGAAGVLQFAEQSELELKLPSSRTAQNQAVGVVVTQSHLGPGGGRGAGGGGGSGGGSEQPFADQWQPAAVHSVWLCNVLQLAPHPYC